MMSTHEDRARFGARLRQQREARSMSVPDIVKLTKIPERSLNFLEGGSFEDLPAEVFVRGFLKSYCRVVGLDVEAILHDYESLVREKKPRIASLARLGQARGDSAQMTAVTTATAASTAPPAGPPPGPATATAAAVEPPPEKTAAEKDKEELSRYARLGDIGKGPGRMGLTVAVIILVIVATVTMSLLLRRPGRGVGDGVSAREVTAAKTPAKIV
jgi:Helix-turn-helix domain